MISNKSYQSLKVWQVKELQVLDNLKDIRCMKVYKMLNRNLKQDLKLVRTREP